MAPEEKYNGWLVSPNFLKRSAAVFGHYFVFSMLVGIVTFIFFAILGFGIFSAIFSSKDFQNMINSPELHQRLENHIMNEFDRYDNKSDIDTIELTGSTVETGSTNY